MRPARLRKRENPECHRLRVAGPTWSLSPFRGYAWGIALRCRSWPPSSRSLESSRIRNGSICSSSPWRLRHLLWRCFSRAAGDSGGSGSVAPLASRGLSPAFRGGGRSWRRSSSRASGVLACCSRTFSTCGTGATARPSDKRNRLRSSIDGTRSAHHLTQQQGRPQVSLASS